MYTYFYIPCKYFIFLRKQFKKNVLQLPGYKRGSGCIHKKTTQPKTQQRRERHTKSRGDEGTYSQYSSLGVRHFAPPFTVKLVPLSAARRAESRHLGVFHLLLHVLQGSSE